jgi:hypothetical protein
MYYPPDIFAVQAYNFRIPQIPAGLQYGQTCKVTVNVVAETNNPNFSRRIYHRLVLSVSK